MAKYQESTPLEQRESHNIGIARYVRELAPAVTAMVVGFGADFLKQRTAPGTAKFRTLGLISIGALAVSPFLIWRKKEKQIVGIQDMYADYKEARALRMDNEQLAKENALLKQMVEFEEQKAIETEKKHDHSPAVQKILAEGPRSHEQHAHKHEAHPANGMAV